MRSSLFLLLIIVLGCSGLPSVAAQSSTSAMYEQEVEQLHELGLFKGTSIGFDLESKPNRAQGAVMLVRLLGKEEFAEDNRYEHPFADVPAWADAHVGYLYEFGLTTGISNDRFGSDEDMLVVHYATFILRALGYDDSQGDFVWNEAVDKLADINLIDSNMSEELSGSIFLRGHVVLLSHKALETPMKDSTTRLIDKLIEEDAVSEEKAIQVGLVIGDDEAEKPVEDEVIDYEKINTFRNHMEYEFKKGPVNMQKVFEYFDEGVSAYALYDTALKYKEDLDVFEQIIERVGKVNIGLHSAIFYENVPLVKLLLENGADVDGISTEFPVGNRPLTTAMAIGYYYIFEKGSGKSSRVDRQSDTSKMVNLLLEAGATISPDVMTNAILNNQIYFVKEHYFKEGYDVQSEGPMYIGLVSEAEAIAPGIWTAYYFGDEVQGTKSMFMQLVYASFHGGFRGELMEWFVQHGAELDDSLSQEQLDYLLIFTLSRENTLLYDFFINAGAIDPADKTFK